MKKNHNEDTELKQKVVTLLSRQQVDFLDRIGKDVFFFGGKKLSRGKIISLLVDILLEHKDKINTQDIKDSQDLKKKILGALKGARPGDGFPSPCQILTAKEGQSLESRNEE